MSQIIVIDAGNTRLKFGLCQTPPKRVGGDERLPALIDIITVDCGLPIPWDLIAKWNSGELDDRPRLGAPARLLKKESLGQLPIVISGSNPPEIQRIIASRPSSLPDLRVLLDRTSLPLRVQVDFPEKVGLDRLLGAVAANVLRQRGQPAIVVDSGTTVTVNAISKSGAFLGGAILPGFELAAKALHQYTALLPLIDYRRIDAGTPPAIGQNTTAALESGMYWGHVGAVKELVV